jgi:hypothetical protein
VNLPCIANAYNNVKKRARASFFHSEQSERC